MGGTTREACTAFDGPRRIASGDLATVAWAVKRAWDKGGPGPVLIFDDRTGEQLDIDLSGTVDEVVARVEVPDEAEAPTEPERRGPGRPRLGVTAREVTLLPRHWEWLAEQPGGASVALRKLVEEARKANGDKDRKRKAREAAYRFLSAMGGNLPGFEEANRALFAGDAAEFDAEVSGWPEDVREHARAMARAAF